MRDLCQFDLVDLAEDIEGTPFRRGRTGLIAAILKDSSGYLIELDLLPGEPNEVLSVPVREEQVVHHVPVPGKRRRQASLHKRIEARYNYSNVRYAELFAKLNHVITTVILPEGSLRELGRHANEGFLSQFDIVEEAHPANWISFAAADYWQKNRAPAQEAA